MAAIRVLASILILVSQLCACATPAVLSRLNPSGKQTVELQVESLGMPHPIVHWRTWTGEGSVQEASIRLAPPLAGCNEAVIYPLRPEALVAPLPDQPYHVIVDLQGRIPDSAERSFWSMTIPDRECSVLLTIGLPEYGWRTIVRSSTSQGVFAIIELPRTVRAEWALLVPAAVIADTVIAIPVAVGFLGLWVAEGYTAEAHNWTWTP